MSEGTIDTAKDDLRVKELLRYDVIDVLQEFAFDHLVNFVVEIKGCAAVFTNLIDAHRQWHSPLAVFHKIHHLGVKTGFASLMLMLLAIT